MYLKLQIPVSSGSSSKEFNWVVSWMFIDGILLYLNKTRTCVIAFPGNHQRKISVDWPTEGMDTVFSRKMCFLVMIFGTNRCFQTAIWRLPNAILEADLGYLILRWQSIQTRCNNQPKNPKTQPLQTAMVWPWLQNELQPVAIQVPLMIVPSWILLEGSADNTKENMAHTHWGRSQELVIEHCWG